MDFSDHVFTTMFEALSNALAAIVGKYAAVIGIVSPALRIGIVIYISLLGYAIMRGAVQYPFREYAYRGCQLAFLYFAVTSLYGSQIGMFALAVSLASLPVRSAEPTSAVWVGFTTSSLAPVLKPPIPCARSLPIIRKPKARCQTLVMRSSQASSWC